MRHEIPARVFRTLAATVLASGLCVSLVKAQAAAEYTLGVSKSAAGAAGMGNTMGSSMSKALNQLSDKLKVQTHETPEPVMKENAAAVDGRPVSRTPTESKVPQGTRAIKITRSDHDQRSEQATVAKGQTVDTRAKTANPYPSVITLSFKDTKK